MSKPNAIDPSKTPVIENAVVRVRSIAATRRRANREFSRTPTDIPTTDLTEAELLALQGDPMLVVEIVGDVPEVDGDESDNTASGRADSSTAEDKPSTEAAKSSPPAPQGPAGKTQPKAKAKR